MPWHDTRIHAIAFAPSTFELLLDVDYLCEWLEPASSTEVYSFWRAPSTLVFENVLDLKIELDFFHTQLQIDSVVRTDPVTPINSAYINKQTEWFWTIDCQQGNISFRSVGFNLTFRTRPVLTQTMSDDPINRGFSFDRSPTTIQPVSEPDANL